LADPLGLIRSVSPGSLGGPSQLAPRPAETGGPSFKDVLMDSLKDVNKLQQEATTAIEDLNTGKRNDVEGVMLATQKADMAFKMLLSVRNKVQAAVEEIKQLRV
jgi:flagellar hook-basal body complex protein FliE